MKLEVARQLFIENRIFIFGSRSGSLEDIGQGCPSDLNYLSDLTIEPYATFFEGSCRNLVSLGAFSFVRSPLPLRVHIGRYSSVGPNFKTTGTRHPVERASTSPVFYNHAAMMKTYKNDRNVSLEPLAYRPSVSRIEIGNDVWIGENVVIADGVKVGTGCVIAPNSFVNQDLPPYSICEGNPSKIVRSRFDHETVADLLTSQWWEYAPEILRKLPIEKPTEFAKELRRGALAGERKLEFNTLSAGDLDNLAR
ncbi:CatB-related O-acetyltransferase [Corynebacterium phoceense]